MIGQKALGWISVVLLMFAAAFFLRYAYQNQWIGPLGRVAIGVAAGAALVVAGRRYHGRGWRVFSQMLTAAGIVVLYLATFSAFGFYHLLPQQAAGVFLVIIVVLSVILAMVYNAPAIALMALIGGLLTPVLMQTERDQYQSLFAYLSVLNAGMVLLLFRRRWAAIGTVALLGTQALFWGWYDGNYHPEKLDWAIGFQAVLYLLFLGHSMGTHWLRSRNADWEQSARLLLGAAFWYAAVYVLLQEDYRVWMGSAAVGMAVVYAVLARLMLICRPTEPRALLTSLAIAVGLIALAMPIQADAAWVALGWMAVAAVLWWFGLRVEAWPLSAMAAALAACALFHVIFLDMPTGSRQPFIPVWNEFALPAIGTAACLLGAVVATRRFLGRLGRPERVLVAAAGLAGILLVWLVLSVDCHGFFDARARAAGSDRSTWLRAGQMSLSVLWAVYATVILAIGFRARLTSLRWLAIAIYGVTVGKVFFFDMAELDEVYRILAFFILALFVGAAAWAYQRIGLGAKPGDSS